MKVCVLTHVYPRYKGDYVAPFIEFTSEAIHRQYIDVTVLIPYDSLINRKKNDHTVKIATYKYIYPLKLHLLGYSRTMIADVKLRKNVYILAPFFLLFSFLALFRICIRERFDLIHAHWILPNGFIGALVSKILHIPLVVSLRGSGVFIAERNPLFLRMAKFTFKTAKGITSNSPELKERLVSAGADPNKFEIIPNGAEPRLFHNVDLELIGTLRNKLNIKSSEIIIFAFGRLVYKKGFDYLLKAMALLLKEYNNLKLVIGGDGELFDELKTLTNKLDIEKHVIFIGSIPHNQAANYFSLCDIFVAPCVKDAKGNVDTCPNVILEAMASRKPVIASRIGGIPLVIKNNQGGILVEEKNEVELANAISYLLKHKEVRESFGVINRERIIKDLSWENIARHFITVYHRSLNTEG